MSVKEVRHDLQFLDAVRRANEALGAVTDLNGIQGNPTSPGYQKVRPTARQHRKWKRREGTAYQFGRLAG